MPHPVVHFEIGCKDKENTDNARGYTISANGLSAKTRVRQGWSTQRMRAVQ
jgi:hypothetical protein